MPCYDSLAIEHFTIDDLDMDSVITYKEKVNKRFPKKKYLEMIHPYLISVLDIIEICPVAFEIYKRLKVEYSFRRR